ncbi:MAG: GIY-YIG nuclease family protein [candidate division Zixibacteria bacterium]|nr:GIY-YIG nuclease family protein [Candidatus Tariuqbacter arcticus]
MKQSFVYIMANKRNGTLYIGVTGDLMRRVYEHKEGLIEGFSKKYGTKILVYYEEFTDIRDAITREKQMKKWKRQWKINAIERMNPNWDDLYIGLF